MKTLRLYMMNFLVICVVAITLIQTLHGSVPISVTVNLPGQGIIQGSYGTTSWTNQTFMQFLGIPYAESPSGELRFKHAIKKLPWRYVLDATTYGRRCPVITSLTNLTTSELEEDLEDCLNLCVYTKNFNARQPVMFYIYGGGFSNGSGIDHPPNFLLEKDVVLVVPNYRIGALGWLATLNEQMPGNAPIGDLHNALQWVQEYIHLFGGDRHSVTIFGQSAGTTMSGALLFSPKTPLEYFQRSIQQSGSIFAPWAINRKPLEQVKRVCRSANCWNCEIMDEIYDCMKNIPVQQLLEATVEEFFSPVIDDFYGILPREPAELFEEYNRSIPLMTGFTKHDGSFLLATVYDKVKAAVGNFSYVPVNQFVKLMVNLAKDDTGVAYNLLSTMLFNNDLLFSTDHKGALPAYFDMTSIMAMKSPVITLARNMLSKKLAPVYLYTFDYEGSNTRFGYEFGNKHYPFEGGVHHSNDNIYIFSTHLLNKADTEMAQKMVEMWTSFAIHGYPKLQNDIELLPMSNEAGPYFHINSNIRIGYGVLKELTATLDDPENHKLDRPNIEF